MNGAFPSCASTSNGLTMNCCRPRTCRRLSRSEEHTSELQSRLHLVCRLLLEKKKQPIQPRSIHPSLNSQNPVSADRLGDGLRGLKDSGLNGRNHCYLLRDIFMQTAPKRRHTL